MTNPKTCSIEDLPRVAGEVLAIADPPYWHDANITKSGDYKCSKCGYMETANITHDTIHGLTCTIPDPIPLTWANAMKHYTAMVEQYGVSAMRNAMREVYLHENPQRVDDGEFEIGNGIVRMFLWGPTEERYLRIACTCKLNERSK